MIYEPGRMSRNLAIHISDPDRGCSEKKCRSCSQSWLRRRWGPELSSGDPIAETSWKACWGHLEDGLDPLSWDQLEWEMLIISNKGKIATKEGLWGDQEEVSYRLLWREQVEQRHRCVVDTLLRVALSCRKNPSWGPASRPSSVLSHLSQEEPKPSYSSITLPGARAFTGGKGAWAWLALSCRNW